MHEFPPHPPMDPDFIPKCMLEKMPTPEERAAIQEGYRLKAEAALRAQYAPEINAARHAAEESLRTQRWAWSCRKLVERAEGYLAMGEFLDHERSKSLRDLTCKANLTVARAIQAATVPYEPEFARAGDPSIREAAREGVAYLTRLDSDEAHERNKEGWGKATMVMGHVLDTLDEFSPSQASHALRILRVHRRQLPAPLAGRLFDVAPERPL